MVVKTYMQWSTSTNRKRRKYQSTEARHLSKKCCILHGKYSYSTDSCKGLRAMVNKHKQKRRKHQELRKEQKGIEISN